MQTLKSILAKTDDKDRRALIQAVINHIGITNVKHVLDLGAGAGWPGFIYNHDTSKFYRRHRDKINRWIMEIAESKNLPPIEMVNDLLTGIIPHQTIEFLQVEIALCLSDEKMTDASVSTLETFFAHFALAQVCRLFHPEKYGLLTLKLC